MSAPGSAASLRERRTDVCAAGDRRAMEESSPCGAGVSRESRLGLGLFELPLVLRSQPVAHLVWGQRLTQQPKEVVPCLSSA